MSVSVLGKFDFAQANAYLASQIEHFNVLLKNAKDKGQKNKYKVIIDDLTILKDEIYGCRYDDSTNFSFCTNLQGTVEDKWHFYPETVDVLEYLELDWEITDPAPTLVFSYPAEGSHASKVLELIDNISE